MEAQFCLSLLHDFDTLLVPISSSVKVDSCMVIVSSDGYYVRHFNLTAII